MQAGEKSGALISTDYALQENRDIYCFDHPFFDNLIHNDGNKKLIEEGANVLKIEV
jgi:predicted Rossmann fold nucleotide-binding protein DprA/Smf involved in DNA uptake